MPVELYHQFSVSHTGGIAVTESPDRQINQRVNALLGTEPGERRMNYDYGVPTRSLLFESDTDAVALQIREQARAKIANYEPGILVNSLKVVPTANGSGLSEIDLNYSRRESPLTPMGIARSTNVAIINIGGTVKEVVNG